MSWLTIALGLVKLSSALIGYLHDNKLIEAGAAVEALDSLEKADAAIEKGRKARQTSVTESELHPDSLRNDDGFKRPD